MLPGNIINNLDFVHENDILLFEGRKAGVEMKKFLNENS
jgi:hypothetical protein